MAPFKAQNMSNNATPALITHSSPFVHSEGSRVTTGIAASANHNDNYKQGDLRWGEIGTAQALQAHACDLISRVEVRFFIIHNNIVWHCSTITRISFVENARNFITR